MYPDIRLIGSIDTVDMNPPSREQTLIVSAAFRSGARGVFRVRLPMSSEYSFAPGDEVFVSGELDELGAIHPTRFGTIRKLAPRTATPQATVPASDESAPAREAGSSVPSPTPIGRSDPLAAPASAASASTNSRTTPVNPGGARPSSPFARPGGAFAGMAFARAGASARPSPRPTPAPTSTTPDPPRAFGGSGRATFRGAAPAGAAPATTAIQARQERQPAVAEASPPRTRTAFAEFLQDEIPW